MLENLMLMHPTPDHAGGYLEMIDKSINIDGSYPYNNIDLARKDFSDFVRELIDEAAGIKMPEDIPPQKTSLGLVRDRLLKNEISSKSQIGN